MTASRFFIPAGLLSLMIGILHLVIPFAGPDAYLFFGAGQEMTDADAAGSLIPDLLTLCIALIFMLFAWYAFSGAGLMKRLPALKFILIFIATIYVLRGLGVIADLLSYFTTQNYPFRNIIFSLVSLLTGVFYSLGIMKGYSYLTIQTKKP